MLLMPLLNFSLKSIEDNLFGNQGGQTSIIEKLSLVDDKCTKEINKNDGIASHRSRRKKTNNGNKDNSNGDDHNNEENNLISSASTIVNGFFIGGGILSLFLLGRYEMIDSGFDFGQVLQNAAIQIESMGPTGYLYFGLLQLERREVKGKK